MWGDISRAINRLCGGAPGETLCARVGREFGHYCLFCRVVGWAVKDPLHCFYEVHGYPKKDSPA